MSAEEGRLSHRHQLHASRSRRFVSLPGRRLRPHRHTLHVADDLAWPVPPFKGLPVTLRAINVHDRGAFERCLKLGFDLFEGAFFTQPSMDATASISSSHALLIQLSNDLRANREVRLVEKAFRNSPKLTSGLLNLINSASFGLAEKISSIKQAIILLGYENLQKWVILLLFTIDHRDDQGDPLVERALVRSRVMELLAKKAGEDDMADSAFITGMLSLIHVLFRVPVVEITEKMNLTGEIQGALLKGEGLLGALLKVAEKMDRQEYGDMEGDVGPLGLSVEDVLTAETSALMDSSVDPRKRRDGR